MYEGERWWVSMIHLKTFWVCCCVERQDIYYGFKFLARQLPKGKYAVYKG